MADPPVLPYHCSTDIDPFSSEVVAEHARREGATELPAPPFVVL